MLDLVLNNVGANNNMRVSIYFTMPIIFMNIIMNIIMNVIMITCKSNCNSNQLHLLSR